MKKILPLLLLLLLFTGCRERTMRYSAIGLESQIEATHWAVKFQELEGNLTEGFLVNPKEYPYLHYDISLASGNMIVQIKQDKETIELPQKKEPLIWKISEKVPFILLYWLKMPRMVSSILNGGKNN